MSKDIETRENEVTTENPTPEAPKTPETSEVKSEAMPKAKASKSPKSKTKVKKTKVQKPQAKKVAKKVTKKAVETSPKKASPNVPKVPKVKIPECCPYRKQSAYATVFAILYSHRRYGITRSELVKEVAKATNKSEKLAYYDCIVVTSPSQQGTAHRSANRSADKYYVEKYGEGKVKLFMR